MNLFQFYKKFDTDEKCIDFLVKERWPNGVICPHCGHNKSYITSNENRQSRVKSQAVIDKRKHPTEFKCASSKCYKKFNVLTNTIFMATKTPLWQFFYLMFSSALNKKSISSYQQAINLGISQKTCWFIMHRIRMLCWQDEALKLDNEVEVDETYLRLAKWKRPKIKAGIERKKPIFGLLQRGGKVIIKAVPNKNKRTIQDVIFKHVNVDSRLFTDDAACYFGLSSYYKHEIVNHREGEYVRGDVYTNGIEAVWNHFKKAIVGTHHGVSKIHLQLYCDEFAYRYNNRDSSATQIFNDLIKRGFDIRIKQNLKTGYISRKTKKEEKLVV